MDAFMTEKLRSRLITQGRCPLCRRSVEGLRFFSLSLFRVYSCSCGLRFIDPSLDGEGQMMIYGSSESLRDVNPALERYYEYDAFKPGSRTYRDYAKALRMLETSGGKGPILEVGCGSGSFLKYAHQQGWQVFGIDSSEPNVSALKQSGIPAACQDFLTFEFTQTFRTIVLWDVLEHFQDPLTFMKKSFQLLEPGGSILIAAPLYPNLLSLLAEALYAVSGGKIRRPMEAMYMIEHTAYFSGKTLTALLEKSGFIKRKAWQTETDLERYAFHPPIRIFLRLFFHIARWFNLRNRILCIGQKPGS